MVFLGYIPSNAYPLRLDRVALDVVRADAPVCWAGNYDSRYKLDPTLWIDVLDQRAPFVRAEVALAVTANSYRLNVHAFEGESAVELADALKKIAPLVKFDILTAHSDAVLLRVEVASLAPLKALLVAAPTIDAMSWLAPFLQQRTRNTGSIGTIHGNTPATCSGTATTICGNAPMWDHGPLGTGQIVAVSDSDTASNMAFFTMLNGNTAIALPDTPTLPATGLSYANNKIFAYSVQP